MTPGQVFGWFCPAGTSSGVLACGHLSRWTGGRVGAAGRRGRSRSRYQPCTACPPPPRIPSLRQLGGDTGTLPTPPAAPGSLPGRPPPLPRRPGPPPRAPPAAVSGLSSGPLPERPPFPLRRPGSPPRARPPPRAPAAWSGPGGRQWPARGPSPTEALGAEEAEAAAAPRPRRADGVARVSAALRPRRRGVCGPRGGGAPGVQVRALAAGPRTPAPGPRPDPRPPGSAALPPTLGGRGRAGGRWGRGPRRPGGAGAGGRVGEGGRRPGPGSRWATNARCPAGAPALPCAAVLHLLAWERMLGSPPRGAARGSPKVACEGRGRPRTRWAGAAGLGTPAGPVAGPARVAARF